MPLNANKSVNIKRDKNKGGMVHFHQLDRKSLTYENVADDRITQTIDSSL